MDFLSNEFDLQFAQIENLTRYPWVGENYSNAKRRFLIVGESHNIKEKEEQVKIKREETQHDCNHTRNCLFQVLVDHSWTNSTFRNLMKALCDRGVIPEDSMALKKIAYYNFIQRSLTYTVTEKERPNDIDYKIAWKCFSQTVEILKPTDCLFVGVESDRGFGNVMEELQIPYRPVKKLEVINGSYPRIAYMTLSCGYELKIVFIKHSSRYFSPQKWHDFLKKQLPGAMAYLNEQDR
ncbi:MAG: hypothetical protein LBQ73_02470 [Tannerellaceae bacterium]|jgi:hypothetical protein|nr:hypothetical protein [Tannerellaceae bacterium]